ncbi:hypothetical protein J4558_14150 [Leptolyngbya sp. 15MV]|nr:hypothetical protein J4558_14150 [Leptolyngbya sp. 15MV]
MQRDLEAFARRVLGLDRLDVVARWSGVMGFTPDGLPLVGPLMPGSPVWFAGGCTGHGMSLMHRVTELAIDAMLSGGSTPFALDRFAIDQAPGPLEPDGLVRSNR